MALYFKCPKCGIHFMDMFGEFAEDIKNDLNGDYLCPKCNTIAESVQSNDIPDDEPVYDLFDFTKKS